MFYEITLYSAFFIFSKSFKFAFDASETAVGAVPYEKDGEGQEWSVGYFSRKLTSH